MRPSVDVLKAIGRLCASQDFLVFVKWLEEESHQAIEATLSSTDRNRIFHEQGVSRTLRDLLRAIKSAKPTLG